MYTNVEIPVSVDLICRSFLDDIVALTDFLNALAEAREIHPADMQHIKQHLTQEAQALLRVLAT